MCKAAWKRDFQSGHEQVGLLKEQRTMGVKRVALGWSKTMWTHIRIDADVAKWGTLARLSCFSLEGSHVTLKRMLRNSGGVSLLHDKLGLQCVVDNYTLDDNLRKEGWDTLSKAVTKQRGYKRRCRDWTRARQEGRGRAAMVESIVQRVLRRMAPKS